MKVYSPSQTENFIRCPRMWDLGKRWTQIEVWTPERALGKAIDAGVLAFLKSKDPEYATLLASEELESEWTHEPYEMSLDAGQAHVKKVLKNTLRKLPDLVPTEVHALHPRLGEENCEPDVIFLNAYGQMDIIDIKYTHTIQPQYVSSRLRQMEPSGQLRHYAWRAMEEYRPLSVSRVGIALITGLPKADVHVSWWDLDHRLLSVWLSGRESVWRQMELVERGIMQPWDSDGNCFKYGEAHACPFYTAHFRLGLDESLFANHYVPRNREP